MAISYRTEPEYIEYLDGKAHAKVSPRREHGLVQARMSRLVEDCAGERGTVSVETDAILKRHDPERTKLIPDVSFISEAQYRAHPQEQWDEPPFSPEIAIEIKSPGDGKKYLREKFARFLATGSKLVLDVDPETRSIIAHTTEGMRSYAEGDRFEHAAMPWLRFELRDVFAVLDRFKNL